MRFTQTGVSLVAALIAGAASIALIALVWYALQNSDPRIWLGLGLLMALSPFAMIWRAIRSDKFKAQKKLEDEQ